MASDESKEFRPTTAPVLGFRMLMAGLLVLLAVVWGATYQITISEEQAAHQNNAVRAARLTDLFADHTAATFRYADDYIKALRRIYLRSHSMAEVRRYMAELPPSSDILSHITMMNADGVPVLISTGKRERKIKPGIHARDRTYFKFQKANKLDTAYISAARRGRNTGILTVRLVRRITDESGKFIGVVFAAVRGNQLLNFFETMRTGPNSSATLVGLDMRIRIRKSHKGIAGVGKKIDGSKLWTSLLKKPKGSYEQTSIVDHVPRLWTYSKLQDYPAVAVIGTAFTDTSARLVETRRFHYLVAALISVIAIVMVFLARRAIVNVRLAAELEAQIRTADELRVAKEEAEEASKAKSQFLSSMSHDLRTPLNAILGFAQMLKMPRGTELSERQLEHVDCIMDGGNHLLELVNNVLDLARIEAGQLELEIKEVDANEVVANCVTLAEPLGEHAGIGINDKFSAGPPVRLNVDETRLRQILLNLISNAVNFNSENGSVTIEALSATDGFCRIGIRDTGIGIAEEDQAMIFQMFQRASANASLAREGTGIGLAVSKLLVERMGGEIGFESELDVGSQFWIELPLTENANRAADTGEA